MVESETLKLTGVIQLRGGTASVLSSVNPLPARREIMVEVDTGKVKVGDGISYWNDLPYVGNGSGGMTLPPNDDNYYIMKNGVWVQATSSGETVPVETSYSATLTAQNISQKYIQLPNRCDTSRVINVFIQGILAERGVDWELSSGASKDLITWTGLGLANIAQAGDKIFVTYYKGE